MHTAKKEYNIKTLNYLGSKLRLLDLIEQNISAITPFEAGVCDLFSGSGCVSFKLSHSYPVVSCDIQNYSRVISNAVLSKFNVSDNETNYFSSILDSTYAKNLNSLFFKIIKIEEDAIASKNLEILATILEHGSIEVARIEKKYNNLYDELSIINNQLVIADLNNEKTLISRYYGGIYFSYRQAVEIDIILEAIHNNVKKENQDLFLAALLSTASEIVNTVGKHFAQPLKVRDSKGNIKKSIYTKIAKDITIKVLPLFNNWLNKYKTLPRSNYKQTIIKGNYIDCLKQLPDNVKTIYADPPYTRDHYSRFYHVLETITLRDMPEISMVTVHGTTHISNGIYRKDRYQSPFCIKSKAPEAFNAMFKAASSTGRNLILSYSPYDETKKTHPRVISIKQLIDLANKYFPIVNIVSAGYFVHNKLNSSKNKLQASNEAEILIICKNN